MPDLVRWEPFRELISLREAMDRLFEESFVRPWGRQLAPLGMEVLAVDMYETDDDIVVKASLPGVKPEEVNISVTGNTLTIKGETKAEEEVKEGNYIRRERRYGAFSRTLTLPTQVEVDKAEAVFAQGVLTLTLPKAEEVKPKSIKVKTQSK
ncbi:MAG TPA: Hsp20/alpha crystallin family protein [Anaerolineae bacterium]|nr:Hsp20/alpha crystallin family protein [Anaerolineae bacterium]